MVAPPHGVRTPIDGGPTQPLPVGGFAPVKPMMPTAMQWPQQQGGPQWAPQAAAPAVPARPPLEARLHPNDRANIIEGIRMGALAAEISPHFPNAQLTIDDLRLIAQQAGLQLNEGGIVPAAAQQSVAPVQQLQPQPQPQPTAAQHEQLAASAAVPIVEKKEVKRITQKHWPAIEQLMNQGANAAQIAQQLGLREDGVERAIKEIVKARGQQQQPPQSPQQGELATLHNGMQSVQSEGLPLRDAVDEVFQEPMASGAVGRAVGALGAVRDFARASGYSYREIEAAAGLLLVAQPVNG